MGTGLKSFFSEEEVIVNQRTILGSQMGKWITLAVLVAVFAALLTAGVVRAQQGDDAIMYAEKGTEPVATFTATDPEGDSITWFVLDVLPSPSPEVDGAVLVQADIEDAVHFTVENGVLTFKESPNFEAPSGEDATSNTYKVVLVASDMATGA